MTGTPLESLLMELVTASSDDDPAAFVRYVHTRLDEELSSQGEAYELIALFAAFAGHAVRSWAEDTDREPDVVLQDISLAMYTEDEA